jgi:hypothetical protein
MVKYICEKCNKVFKQRGHLITHLNKLRPCNDEKVYLNNKKNIKTPKLHQNETNSTKNNNIVQEENDNNSILNNKKREHICIVCDKSFTRDASLKRHLIGRCKIINNEILINNDDNDDKKDKKDDTHIKKISVLEEKIINLTQLIIKLSEDSKIPTSNLINNNGIIDNSKNDNNINNTNIANQVNNQVNGNITTNNIKIEFGKEDLDKISNDFFIKTLINFSGAAIPSKIIEGIHFNPEFKEFMNVFITDISRNKAMIYDGKKWNIANADEVIDTLFDRAIIFCENRNEELYDKIQKNDKINKKINKEMHIMDIMSNNEPYDYNDYKQPIDSNGKILNSSELLRGKNLNAKAKEHLKNNLYNKKTTILK